MKEYVVDIETFVKIQSPDQAVIEMLYPFTGIAIYNPATKTGYLGFFSEVNEKTKQMMQDALQPSSTREQVRLILRGGAVDREGDEAGDRYDKEILEGFYKEARQYGLDPKQIDIRFTDNVILEMRLNTESGEVQAQEADLDQLLEDQRFATVH